MINPFLLKKTCSCFPAQWELMSQKIAVYIRYRNGRFRFYACPMAADIAYDIVNGFVPFSVMDSENLLHDEKIGKDYDGYMSDFTMREVLLKNHLCNDLGFFGYAKHYLLGFLEYFIGYSTRFLRYLSNY